MDAYIAMVNAGDYANAIREFYHLDARMHENRKPPREGREALVANEERAMAKTKSIRALKLEAFQGAGGDVAIHSVYEIVEADGRKWTLDEMSIQRWRGDRIAEEFFFYDPGQRDPK
ncbi:MAG TPA: nuclear transport factor 2 family protein [Usitatibacter sp.]|nr:nuclear transport factor 2 family protein [Usitatibacter sp.]